MKTLPLEDNYLDVIGKAQRGWGISDDTLAGQASLTVERWLQLKRGQTPTSTELFQLAQALHLHGPALILMAENKGDWPSIEVPGLYTFTSPFREMLVNAYLVADPATKKAALFDTGTDIGPVLQTLKEQSYHLEAIFLTHTHGDHILELDLLKEKTGVPAYVQDREPLAGALSFTAGKVFTIGQLRIETRATIGHSQGGTTYVVQGLFSTLAMVGDALFALSMGGGNYSYAEALRTNREQIFSLDPETILCPGHGPMTTVRLESHVNPFFAESD